MKQHLAYWLFLEIYIIRWRHRVLFTLYCESIGPMYIISWMHWDYLNYTVNASGLFAVYCELIRAVYIKLNAFGLLYDIVNALLLYCECKWTNMAQICQFCISYFFFLITASHHWNHVEWYVPGSGCHKTNFHKNDSWKLTPACRSD